MSDAEKLWGGRFQSPVDPVIHRYTASLPFDCRLARCDLIGSLAHARMLYECGILEGGDGEAILQGLADLLLEVESGKLVVDGEDEDIHSWIERLLGERIGEPARRLHTARSRNDQTSVALRLYVRQALRAIASQAVDLQRDLLELAGDHVETWLPGYTHLQRGQPVSLAHQILAHFWALEADVDRFRRAHAGAGVSPLGAAALAGSPYPTDAARSAELLGLPSVYPNSMLAVADRDYVLETAFVCTVSMLHLSRWASEVILWSSAEFGFVEIGDSVAKGSSLMPQKRNPEAAEILRGKSGRVVGDLMAVATVVKGLPLTYNSDLQEDKESLFDALDTVLASLTAASAILRGLSFRKARMTAALTGGYVTATDLADYLVRRGVPFRSAHHQVGEVVRLAESRGIELWELSLQELREICPSVEEDVFESLEPERSVRSHRSLAGPAPQSVAQQLRQAEAALVASEAWLSTDDEPPIAVAARQGRVLSEAIP